MPLNKTIMLNYTIILKITKVPFLAGTTIIHVNALHSLHRDISGDRDNFNCNAHDQYSHMEANMAEIADAKCEHAQYARRNPFN